MIGIIDYGMGNLRSVENALCKLGREYIITSDKNVLDQCERLILPGVGAFGDCAENLKKAGLFDWIRESAQKGKPLLGICLGMQMLFEDSEEKVMHEGLCLLKGHVRFMEDTSVSIPEIGWNELVFAKKLPIDLSPRPYVYYVHSYYAQDVDPEDLVAYSEYGNMKITGIVKKGNIMGCQFHPEKSGRDGLKILQHFTEADL